MSPRVHRFPGNTSREVYDFTQTWDIIHDGDVLIVPDEGVVGILVQAWPVAVSANPGEFHETGPGWRWEAVEQVGSGVVRDYSESFALAAEEFPKAMAGAA